MRCLSVHLLTLTRNEKNFKCQTTLLSLPTAKFGKMIWLTVITFLLFWFTLISGQDGYQALSSDTLDTQPLSCSFNHTFCGWSANTSRVAITRRFDELGGAHSLSPSGSNFAFAQFGYAAAKSLMLSQPLNQSRATQISFRYIVYGYPDIYFHLVLSTVSATRRNYLWSLGGWNFAPTNTWLSARASICETSDFRIEFELDFGSGFRGTRYNGVGLADLVINDETTALSSVGHDDFMDCYGLSSYRSSVTCGLTKINSTSSFCGWLTDGIAFQQGLKPYDALENGAELSGYAYLYVRPNGTSSRVTIQSPPVRPTKLSGVFSFWFKCDGCREDAVQLLVSEDSMATNFSLGTVWQSEWTTWGPRSYTYAAANFSRNSSITFAFNIDFGQRATAEFGLDRVWYDAESAFEEDTAVALSHVSFSTTTEKIESGFLKNFNNTPTIVGTFLSAVVLLVGFGVALSICKRPGLPNSNVSRRPLDIEEAHPQPIITPYTKMLDVRRSSLEIDPASVLGRGQSGIVYKGVAYCLPTTSRVPTPVAVKTHIVSADSDQQTQFADDLKIMIKAGRHVNIVNILGIVNERQPMLIFEFCQHGSLLSYLHEVKLQLQWQTVCAQDNRTVELDDITVHMLTTSDLIKFSHQISRGMEYLTSRSIIHRDLAARNVLVSDGGIMKISDFGLARHSAAAYIASNTFIPLPVLWMPPESITTGVFSEKSDVWSFGVLLWEIFSLGQVPYDRPNMARFSVSTFADWLMEGHQMTRPDCSPLAVFDLMKLCWKLDKDDRPTFATIATILDTFVYDMNGGSDYLSLQ